MLLGPHPIQGGAGERTPSPVGVMPTLPAVPCPGSSVPSTGIIRVSLNPAFEYDMVVRDASVDLITLTGREPIHHAFSVAPPGSVARGVPHIRLPTPSGARSIVFTHPSRGVVDEGNPWRSSRLAARCAAFRFFFCFPLRVSRVLAF